MKAKWNALPKGKNETIINIKDFDKTQNLIEKDGKIQTRLGRYPFKEFSHWQNKPERLFALADDCLAVSFRNATTPDKIEIQNCDTTAFISSFNNGGEYDITEIWSKSADKLMTIFPSTYGDTLKIFSNNTFAKDAGHWGHSYLCVLNNRVFAAKRSANYVNGYEEGDFNWSGKRQLTFYIDGKKSPCTGLAAFKENLIYFSRHCMHMININTTKTKEKDATGTQIEILDDNVTHNILFEDIGCVSCYTIGNICGELIWLGAEGVYKWDGKGNPKMISGEINKGIKAFDNIELWTKPQGFALGGKYYLTFCGMDLQGKTFVYDSESKSWSAYQYETPLISMEVNDGKLLGLAVDAKIYALEREILNENIEWLAEKEINNNLKKIKIIADGNINAKLILTNREINLQKTPNNYFLIPTHEIYDENKIILRIYGNGKTEIKEIELFYGGDL